MNTVRGQAVVYWRPAYTLTVESPDGTELPADGVAHDLVATLTKTLTGDPVPGRTLKLKTDPINEVGHDKRKTTNASGEVKFRVSDDEVESVEYTVSLVPKPATSSVTVSEDITIQWGSSECQSCTFFLGDIVEGVVGDDPAFFYFWYILYTTQTFSGPLCEPDVQVTHCVGQVYIRDDNAITCGDYFEFGGPPVDTVDVDNVSCVKGPVLDGEELDDLLAGYAAAAAAAHAALLAAQC